MRGRKKGMGRRLLTFILTAAMLLNLTAPSAAFPATVAKADVKSPEVQQNDKGLYDVTFRYEGGGGYRSGARDIPGNRLGK